MPNVLKLDLKMTKKTSRGKSVSEKTGMISARSKISNQSTAKGSSRRQSTINSKRSKPTSTSAVKSKLPMKAQKTTSSGKEVSKNNTNQTSGSNNSIFDGLDRQVELGLSNVDSFESLPEDNTHLRIPEKGATENLQANSVMYPSSDERLCRSGLGMNDQVKNSSVHEFLPSKYSTSNSRSKNSEVIDSERAFASRLANPRTSMLTIDR